MLLAPAGKEEPQQHLTVQLGKGWEVTFDDEQLGKLARYMAQYNSGGFQGRLRQAFLRPLRELLGL